MTGTDITSFDFPNSLTTAETDQHLVVSEMTLDFQEILQWSHPIDNIASPKIVFQVLVPSWRNRNFANTDLGKLVADSTGKIVDIAKTVVDEYETALSELQKGFTKLMQ